MKLFMFPLIRIFHLLLVGAISIPGISAQPWQMSQRLSSAQPDPLDFAGISVDISDSLMVMGAWWDDNNDNSPGVDGSGAVYVFRLAKDGNWTLIQKLSSSAPEHLGYFGFDVAVEGNTIAVGAYNEDQTGGSLNNTGAVYIFEILTDGSVQEVDKLTAPDAGQADLFGHSISISEDRVLIGAYEHKFDVQQQNEMDGAGAAYVFQKQNDQWNFRQKLVASDRNEDDNFAKYLDISGTRIIIGAEDHDQGFLFDAGTAFIFEYNASLDQWVEVQQLFASDASAFKDFGWDVAIDGDLALVGASAELLRPDGTTGSNSGAVYAFQRNSQGVWQEIQKIFTPDFNQNDFFGRSIDLQDGYAVIGSDMEDEDANGNNAVFGAGSAYVFKWEDQEWNFNQKLIGTDREINDLFGGSVALSWPHIAIGASKADVAFNGNSIIDAGAGYIFLSEEDIVSATNEFSKPKVQISPNPSSQYLTIISEDGPLDKISIYTAAGLFVRDLKAQQGTFNLGQLPSANYLIAVWFDGKLAAVPWLKY